MNKTTTVVALSALLSGYSFALSGLANSHDSEPAAGLGAQDPCAPNVAGPPPTRNPLAPPTPTRLRIVGGSGGGNEAFDQDGDLDIDVPSGPFVWPDRPEAASVAAPHDYFDMLTARPDCLTSYHFRTQENIDSVRSRAESDIKIPIVYSALHDAAKFEIDPSGSLPHSGSTGTPQKRMPINIQGATSMLLTWELKIDKSMQWKPGYLPQHKSHRLDDLSASPWVGLKQDYAKATNRGDGIAYYFLSAAPAHMGPGTTRGAAERIEPISGEFYIQPDTWTRVWVFVEGNIGVGDRAVRMSVWLADEKRARVQLYNRVNMVTPQDGIGLFRFEFDSSTKKAANGPGQQYQRNFVVLQGVTAAQVEGLLQKP